MLKIKHKYGKASRQERYKLFCSSHTEPDQPESDLDHAENTDPSEEAEDTTWQ